MNYLSYVLTATQMNVDLLFLFNLTLWFHFCCSLFFDFQIPYHFPNFTTLITLNIISLAHIFLFIALRADIIDEENSIK